MVMIREKGRPYDWGYMAMFRRKDLSSLEHMTVHIRETHDIDMIEDFNQKCEQKLFGQSAEINGIELQAVTKTEDLVTTVGLQQCINIILGTSTVRWANLAFSLSSGAPSPAITDTNISNATTTQFVPMATLGWMEPKGMKLFFGGVDGETHETLTINEMGVYNGTPTTSTLLNREHFPNNPISRSFTADLAHSNAVAIFSCVIEFCPVT